MEKIKNQFIEYNGPPSTLASSYKRVINRLKAKCNFWERKVKNDNVTVGTKFTKKFEFSKQVK